MIRVNRVVYAMVLGVASAGTTFMVGTLIGAHGAWPAAAAAFLLTFLVSPLYLPKESGNDQ